MKREQYLILGIMLIVLVSGCVDRNTQYVCSDGRIISSPNQCSNNLGEPSEPIATFTCGNSMCEEIGENYKSCPQDCEEPTNCNDNEIFSQKDCKCVEDTYNCSDPIIGNYENHKKICEDRPNCEYSCRSGSCGCPQCENYGCQCLPK